MTGAGLKPCATAEPTGRLRGAARAVSSGGGWMKYLSLGVLILGSTMAAGAQIPAPEGGDKVLREPLTLTGCVAAGTKANTFVLTNVQRTDAPATVSADTIVYWLSSPDKLKGHAGHEVEIEGVLEDDVDKSATKTEDGKVELSTER